MVYAKRRDAMLPDNGPSVSMTVEVQQSLISSPVGRGQRWIRGFRRAPYG